MKLWGAGKRSTKEIVETDLWIFLCFILPATCGIDGQRRQLVLVHVASNMQLPPQSHSLRLLCVANFRLFGKQQRPICGEGGHGGKVKAVAAIQGLQLFTCLQIPQ